MELRQVLGSRRSIRFLLPYKPVEPEKIQLWNPDIVSEEPMTPGPPGVGAKSAVKIREGSRVVDYVSEVVTFQPEELLYFLLRHLVVGIVVLDRTAGLDGVEGIHSLQ